MNTSLPIYQVKEAFLDAVQKSNVVILSAETGSGKSTQIPQILLQKLNLSSISTQPRRLACVSLAERVREEMGDSIGEFVGYKTAFEEDYKEESNRILFTTDGLLAASGIESFHKVVIMDEVHERSLNIEVLIAWAKKKLKEGSGMKFILMSATFDCKELSSFFEEFHPIVVNCPKSPYHVEEIQDTIHTSVYLAVKYAREGKNILCFFAGKGDIEKAEKALREDLPSKDFFIFSVHGDQTVEEQCPAFSHVFPSTKIILCTNICQTSITIDDIDVVIDNGEAKVSRIQNGIKGLFLENISKSDCMQRRGRAGRTKDGIYILCSNSGINSRKSYPDPEIQRVFLTETVLRLASLGLDASELEFLHQPSKKAIREAKDKLVALGGLDEDGKITDIGLRMSFLPLDAVYARMMLETEKYGEKVLDAMAKICAVLEVGGLFQYKNPKGKFFYFTKESQSDLLAGMDVFNWIEEKLGSKLSPLDSLDSFPWKDFGLNRKSYEKAKEYYLKVKELPWDYTESLDMDEENDSIQSEYMIRKLLLRCIVISMINYVQTIHFYEDEYDDYYDYDYGFNMRRKHGIIEKLDENSCLIENSLSHILAIPKTIEYKQKSFFPMDTFWDIGGRKKSTNLKKREKEDPNEIQTSVPKYAEQFEKKKITILTNATRLDKELLLDAFGKDGDFLVNHFSGWHDAITERFYINENHVSFKLRDGREFKIYGITGHHSDAEFLYFEPETYNEFLKKPVPEEDRSIQIGNKKLSFGKVFFPLNKHDRERLRNNPSYHPMLDSIGNFCPTEVPLSPIAEPHLSKLVEVAIEKEYQNLCDKEDAIERLDSSTDRAKRKKARLLKRERKRHDKIETTKYWRGKLPFASGDMIYSVILSEEDIVGDKKLFWMSMIHSQ